MSTHFNGISLQQFSKTIMAQQASGAVTQKLIYLRSIQIISSKGEGHTRKKI